MPSLSCWVAAVFSATERFMGIVLKGDEPGVSHYIHALPFCLRIQEAKQETQNP